MKRYAASFSLAIIFALGIAGSSYAGSAKNLDLSVSSPSVVKIKRNACSTFNVSYQVGLHARSNHFANFYLGLYRGSVEQSDPSAAFIWNYNEFTKNPTLHDPSDRPANGVFKIKFCDYDWLLQGQSAIAGVDPGRYQLAIESDVPSTNGMSTKYIYIPIRFSY